VARQWPRAITRHQARVEALDEGEVDAPLAGSCTPPLPALPPRVNDDVDTDRPLVAYGRSTEAAALAVAVPIVA
jgi:hypothetical protein